MTGECASCVAAIDRVQICVHLSCSPSLNERAMANNQPYPLLTAKTLVFFHFSFFLLLSSLFKQCYAVVFLRGESFALTFNDVQARFAVPINGSGICGALYVADAYDACSSLRNGLNMGEAGTVRFALIARGTCSFEEKVRNAQDGGFQAVIIYNNKEKENLISMIGNSSGIRIHAVFISKRAGETLKKFAIGGEGECCISSSSEDTTWTVLAISFISLQLIVALLGIIFVARNHWLHQYQQRLHQLGTQRQHSSAMSKLARVLPSFKFSAACINGKFTSETCAICLEDYKAGDTLRALPCQHEFHVSCVDSWLMRRKFCPVCKHDVSMDRIENPVCDSTPLLSHSTLSHPNTASSLFGSLGATVPSTSENHSSTRLSMSSSIN